MLRRLLHDALKFAFWYPVAGMATRTPLPAAYALAGAAGALYARAAPARAHIIRDEIGKLLGRSADEVPHSVARQTCQQFAKSQLELLRAPRLSSQGLGRMVELEGREHLDRALARGNGAILILLHYGANQLIIPAVKHLGYDLLQFGAPPQAWHDLHGRTPSRLDRRIFARRLAVERALGVEFLYIERSLRPAYQALKKNRLLAIAADGRAGSKFVPVPFGARTAMLAPGPVGLAFRTGAALIPTFIERGPDDRHRLILHEALPVADATGAPIPPKDVLAGFVQIAMAYIERKPGHYGWLLQAARQRAPIDRVPLFTDLAGVPDRSSGVTPPATPPGRR